MHFILWDLMYQSDLFYENVHFYKHNVQKWRYINEKLVGVNAL